MYTHRARRVWKQNFKANTTRSTNGKLTRSTNSHSKLPALDFSAYVLNWCTIHCPFANHHSRCRRWQGQCPPHVPGPVRSRQEPEEQNCPHISIYTGKSIWDNIIICIQWSRTNVQSSIDWEHQPGRTTAIITKCTKVTKSSAYFRQRAKPAI